MPDQIDQRLRGRCVLVVEDDYFFASELARGLSRAGCDIAGPVPTTAQAAALLELRHIDLAVLDIGLDGEKVFSLADVLQARGIPFIFVTGYDASAVPSRYAGVLHCLKPVSVGTVTASLAKARPALAEASASPLSIPVIVRF